MNRRLLLIFMVAGVCLYSDCGDIDPLLPGTAYRVSYLNQTGEDLVMRFFYLKKNGFASVSEDTIKVGQQFPPPPRFLYVTPDDNYKIPYTRIDIHLLTSSRCKRYDASDTAAIFDVRGSSYEIIDSTGGGIADYQKIYIVRYTFTEAGLEQAKDCK